jgi:hypothetical protein
MCQWCGRAGGTHCFRPAAGDPAGALQIIVANLARPEESDDVLLERLQALVARTTCPLGLYECPEPYHRLLSLEALRWIAVSKRFVFLKAGPIARRIAAPCSVSRAGTGLTGAEPRAGHVPREHGHLPTPGSPPLGGPHPVQVVQRQRHHPAAFAP